VIRVGYLRFEIDATDKRSKQDNWSNEVTLTARPTYRNVRLKWSNLSIAQKNFVHGDGNFANVLAAQQEDFLYDDIEIPDVGPRVWRYSLSDKEKTPRFWMTKIKQFTSGFAAEIVSAAGAYRQLVINNPILRSNYARLVELEIFRVIDGTSKPMPTITTEKMEVDVTQHTESGVPELVAAILVKDVFEPEHFEEFAHKNHVTIKGSDGYTYRIPRKTHGLIQVWDEKRKPKQRLCVVFQDPGMPPSDEIVMKYLLVKHDLKTLWNVGVRFPFEATADILGE
jgi:hypothetical protein